MSAQDRCVVRVKGAPGLGWGQPGVLVASGKKR